MELTKQINPRQEVIPRVYAYVIPDYPKRAGWVKIGYTERDVDKRIHEQSGTIGVDTKTLWHYIARFNEGEYFTDRDFHGYLVKNGIEREKAKEWLIANPDWTIGEVADRAGFASQHYFSTLFRRHVGLSPRQYRDRG